MDIGALLKKHYPNELVDSVISSYNEIEKNFAARKWKASEVDAGHFVEGVRRILEYELFGNKYTPLNKSLSPFNDKALHKYEGAIGDDSLRMLIPRVLKAVYNIRNKRGSAHLAGISANEMDSTIILYSVKWVLAELVRLNSSLSAAETQSLVNKIVERKLEVLWKDGDITRILDHNMKSSDQVLVLLYDESPRSSQNLQHIVEYKNKTNFTKVLKRLHAKKLIELSGNGNCSISPKGVIEAEKIISEYI